MTGDRKHLAPAIAPGASEERALAASAVRAEGCGPCRM